MKKILSYTFLFLCLQTVSAQNNWFTTYKDSVSLLTDATTIADNFKKEVSKFKNDGKFTTKTIVNTTPYLIFFDGKNQVNIPLWSQVLPELKAFTKEVAGSEDE